MNQKEKAYSHFIKAMSLFNGSFLNYLDSKSLLLYYSDFTTNWGDNLNPYLIEKITKKRVVSSKRIYNILGRSEIYGIGSILKSNLANAVIWGSGFIHENASIEVPPKKTLALRGKLSAEIFHRSNIETNNIYGDPALLFPRYFNLKENKKFKLGIIPHYTEINHPVVTAIKEKNRGEVNIINPKNDILRFVEEVLKCECVLSSSLHGLIISDAYSIPNCRFTLTNNIIGNNFKFDDYYSGVGIDKHLKIDLNKPMNNLESLISVTYKKELNFAPSLLEGVLLDFVAELK